MLNAGSAVTPTRVLRPEHLVALCHISAAAIPSGTSGFPVMQCLARSHSGLNSQNMQKHALSGLVQCIWNKGVYCKSG